MENQGTPNQDNSNQVFSQQFRQLQQLPNSTAVLVLGIISLPVCFCYFLMGIPGFVLSIISLSMASKAKKIYEVNPSLYTPGSYNNLKAGRVCAIIGLVLNSILLITVIIVFVMFASTGVAIESILHDMHVR